MSKRKVVLTGASGTIASVLLPALRERYDLTLLDARAKDRNGVEVEGLQVVDLMNKDRDRYRQFFTGADAVVHCAYYRVQDQGDDAYFSSELENLQLTYNVYQVAWEEGARRLVAASTNHAADFYENYALEGRVPMVTPDQNASDNWYGWAKIAFEQIGQVYASGVSHNGRPLENVQIRIGGPRETDLAEAPLGDLRRMRRALAVYISQRDMSQLFIKSIETEDISDDLGVPFQIFYGISANSHAIWSIANARRVIGYAPQDNSEERFFDLIQAHMKAAGKTSR
ncbi:MAG: NAD(P)-dependent oxidoreductase [Chloroflexota bacterium]|nr:NAD(P)-dependent oxidoreductase [Chloroflexota bacterium]